MFNPFPGLRPFTQEEAHLFFGREGQSRSVLQSLKANNFVAVIGASGTGKSSLIYCGVIPELLKQADRKWTAVPTRPGSLPVTNLINAVKSKFNKKVTAEEKEKLISGKHKMQDWLAGILPADQSLLLVIDQFEEIFRYKQAEFKETNLAEIESFVKLIYEGCTAGNNPISVVLTMRSDFIGECAAFQDLTDLINRSNYLIPQMTREDFRSAIEGPVKIGGATIDENLVNQLLDEVGNNTDQLPVLQHALMRSWDYWALQNDPEKPIDIGDYEAIGRMEKALSDHANEAYDELDEDQREVCESMFKTITEKGGDNRGVRRPSKISRVAEITKQSPGDIIKIAEVFRATGRTFLTPYQPVELNENTVIDISHESLMRIWDRLRLWVDEEAGSVQMYRKLSEAAKLYQEGTGGLWRPPDLQIALNWRESQQPTATWAVQYNPAFERAMVYLDTSESEFKKEEENKIRLQKRRLRVTRMFSLVLGAIAVVAMGLFLWTRDLQTEAEQRRLEAEKQTELAQEAAEEARLAQLAAQASADTAELERQRALEQSQIAELRRVEAEEASQLATEQQLLAQQRAEEARLAQIAAQNSADTADQERQRAVLASEEALKRRMLSIAQSMAVKSTQMRTDTMLKGLLAYQAYDFNKAYEGVPYDPDVFRSAYSGMKFFRGAGYNVFKGHNSIVRSLLSDEGRIISGSSEGKVISWNVGDTEASVMMADLPIIQKVLVGNPSLICLTNRSIVKFNYSSKEKDDYEFPDFEIKDLFVTNEKKYIVVYNDHLNLADDYKTGGDLFYETDNRINIVKYDETSGNLFMGLSDGSIYYWSNFHTGSLEPELLAQIPDGNWSEINFHPERNMVAAGTGNSQGAIYLWDLETGEEINSLRGHNARVTAIRFSNNGKLMASSSNDGVVNIWQLDDLNTLPIVFDDHATWVTSLTFTPDDRYVISGDKDGNLKTLPTDIDMLIDDYCKYLTRELTEGEWQNYVGTDLEYEPATCD